METCSRRDSSTHGASPHRPLARGARHVLVRTDEQKRTGGGLCCHRRYVCLRCPRFRCNDFAILGSSHVTQRVHGELSVSNSIPNHGLGEVKRVKSRYSMCFRYVSNPYPCFNGNLRDCNHAIFTWKLRKGSHVGRCPASPTSDCIAFPRKWRVRIDQPHPAVAFRLSPVACRLFLLWLTGRGRW